MNRGIKDGNLISASIVKSALAHQEVASKHELRRIGVRPYQCKYCDNCFSLSKLCLLHIRTHTGMRPYKCKYCGKLFSQSSQGKNHELTHIRVK